MDPFGDDQNPFAEVDEYNPFASGTRVIINETQPVSNYVPPPAANPFVSPNYETPIQLDSDSDEGDASYFGLQEEENPYSFDDKPPTFNNPSSSTTSTSRGVISVQQTQSDPNDDQSVWELEYYKRYFDVDSSEVGWRCLRSMWPFKVDFITFVSTNPDFYGPFWITTTLIFMLAACANFEAYLHNSVGWKYDFLKLTVGTGIIYGFAFGVPLLFWLYFKWADLNISLIELLCIYGYSLFVYCPIAVICVAPLNPLQWTAMVVGCLLSTSFLVVNMWPPLKAQLAHAIPLIALMALLHGALGLTFMLYFFQFNGSNDIQPVTPPTNTTH